MAIEYWHGTEESYEIVAKASIEILKHKADRLADMLAELPPISQTEDGLCTINISGSLVSGYAGAGRLFGTLGYADIGDALVDAMTDPDVKSIMLLTDSGGGSVNGVAELANNVARYSKIKPIAAHADRVAASAAYWTIAAASPITVSETAITGSIGTLTIHTEYSQALAKDGVTKTVMRSGDYKALSNPYEPLTDTAKAEIQSQLDDMTGIFYKGVMSSRGLTADQMDAAGKGREFLGKRAVQVGLADKVMSQEKALTNVKRLDAAKTMPNNRNNSKGTSAMKYLNDAQLAQISAGVPVAAILAASNLTPAQKAEVTAEIAVSAAEILASSEADKAKKAVEDAALATATAAKAASTTVVAGADTVVAHLTAQLEKANESITLAKIEAAAAKAETLVVKALAELVEPLTKIVRASAARMHVALGGTAAAVDSLDAKAAIAEHDRIQATFLEKFKPGAQANTATVTKPAENTGMPAGFSAAVKFAPGANVKN